jgi:hypothetical protein
MDVEVLEILPGEYEVTHADTAVRVLVPPGVGLPGVSEEDLAGALVAELLARGQRPAGTMDVTQLLRSDPSLLGAIEARVEAG